MGAGHRLPNYCSGDICDRNVLFKITAGFEEPVSTPILEVTILRSIEAIAERDFQFLKPKESYSKD